MAGKHCKHLDSFVLHIVPDALQIRDYNYHNTQALVRASALGMFAELRHLSLGNNRTLQAAGVKELACVLMCLSTPLYLTHLDISRACGDDDPESPAAAKSLALALSRLNSLKHLNLGTNDGFGAKGNEAIAQAVGRGCPNLVGASLNEK